MRIAIGCDHAGFTLKAPLVGAIEADGHDLLDLGTFSTDPVDYPDFAKSVGQAVLRGFVEAGVLVCGSGVGASIAANKLPGVRAALCHDVFTARQSREDDDANVLCLGARVLDENTAVEVTRAWLATRFSGEERHVRRVAKITQLEGALPADRVAGRPGSPAAGVTPPATVRPVPGAPAAGPAAPQPPQRVTAPPIVQPPAPRPTPAAAAVRASAAPAAPKPAPPPAPPTPPRRPEGPGRVDPLAAQAEELFRQFEERHPEDKPAPRREGVISVEETDAGVLEIEMPEPKVRRPEPRAPAPKPTPEPKAAPARPAPEAKPRAPEPRRPAAPVVPAEPPKPPPPPEPELPPLPDAFRLPAVREALATLQSEDYLGRVWAKDVELWNGDVTEIRNRLGWLTSPTVMGQHAEDIRSFADEIRRLQHTHVVILGMGGSSSAAEVFEQTFGSKMGFPDLLVLDSTDPAAVKRALGRINLARSLFVVSTKTGTTVETLSFYAFFRAQVDANKPPKPGQQFVAITDPGTPVEKLAGEGGFRRVFLNPPTIGGRYSALSFVGLVPAALIGVDIRIILERALAMVEACGHEVPVQDNPAVRLGAALAAFAKTGRDKLTLVLSEKIRPLGAWIEQLVAESLGKDGTGVVPVNGEPLGPPEVYRDDRVFVALMLEGDRSHAALLAKLAGAGHPVIRLTLKDSFDVGGEFFRWALATATAGALLGVNPFNEPDVAAAKDKANAMLTAWKKSRRLPDWSVAAEDGGIALMTRERQRAASVAEALTAHLASGQPGDYVALLAYVNPHTEAGSRLQEIRTLLRDRYRLATTVAYGPRYLHSTGQLHKGGPASGLFIQITGEDADDLAIPGAGHGFGTLKATQALGDLEALSAAGRRVIRLHLRGRSGSALDTLAQLFRTAARPS